MHSEVIVGQNWILAFFTLPKHQSDELVSLLPVDKLKQLCLVVILSNRFAEAEICSPWETS